MIRHLIAIILPMIVALINILGCGATVPNIRVWRPWYRTVQGSQTIPVNSKLKVLALGETTPLVGDDLLVSERITFELGRLLSRRGFAVADSATDYLVTLRYRTVSQQLTSFSSEFASKSMTNAYSYNAIGAGAMSGLGVVVANAVAGAASVSSTVSKTVANEYTAYIHSLAIELSDNRGVIIWKCDATWTLPELDLLEKLTPKLQIMLSDLPSDSTILPTVPQVKESHVQNYVRLFCENRWFSCPALPYSISFFVVSKYDTWNSYGLEVKTAETLKGFSDTTAISAIVDLVQTAEFALPLGSKDWTDPRTPELWKEVLLGGRYRLSPSNKVVTILVRLRGNSNGYNVERSWIASEDEYSDFQRRMGEWKAALRNYYDVFER